MSAQEGGGYLGPLTCNCLVGPALNNVKTAHATTPAATEAISGLDEALLKADGESPAFLYDLAKILMEESLLNIDIQESFLRLQAKAPSTDLELNELSHIPRFQAISEKAIHLRKVLSRIPDEMADRRPFLETIKEIATSIRVLLDAANDIVRSVPPNVHPSIEKRKREFVHYSKRFSNTLKDYFRVHDAGQVFVASNQLIFQTIQLIRCIRERVPGSA
ncbi:unnamed protein product [Bursaphelenchus okinawaensis]|uniref:Programmed cell death protein 10 dimerisation domain-containing protein n=1 Tax=Bursaphelenchus okinawaensis TaxID=465554 RepID=A0A811K521_9BILA|nr:unnamed protein product [Bursaphelenchus okinawaensis]CAG9092658.1 unnamed protein product [Bursaphelenchus okinawaensis]